MARHLWLVVDDPDGFDYPQPWEVQDPEPFEPIETADEITAALDAGWEPRGAISDPVRPARRYIGKHRR